MPQKNHRFFIVLLLIGLNINLALSQTFYPNNSSFLRVLSASGQINQSNFTDNPADSVITNYQNYYPRNTSGNLGLPSAQLDFLYKVKSLGFKMYDAPYHNDMINADDVLFYQTQGPYANLSGIAGSKQEQMFKLLFSNSFKNKLNLTLTFNRYSGLGFYKRQQSFTNNFYTSSNYTNKSGRVGYYAYFLFNKVKHLENGGISNDSLFESNTLVNKQLIPVNLSQAKREVRQTNIYVNPWFKLNKSSDSSSIISHFIDYQFTYNGNFSKYVDAASAIDNYYSVFYIDTLQTKDSTHWRTVTNALNYSVKINPINTKFKFGVKQEINQVYQYIDSTFNNIIADAGVYITDKNYLGFLKASYIANGSNASDYSIEFNNKYTLAFGEKLFKSRLVLKLNAQIEKRHPDFIYNTWYSNHFQWTNAFNPIEKTQSEFSISSQDKRFEAGVIGQQYNNYIFFNEQAQAQQHNNQINNLLLFIKKDILLFKHLGIGAKYNYQSSSHQNIVCVPNHQVNGALYYQGNLFKNALNIQIGFSAQYFSDFYAYAYMPALNQYYVQTQEQIGEYTYLDFFINARIKPVRFFVKIDHVNQGLMGKNYTLTPGYLQNDRAFKFGLNWLFFD